MHRQFRTRNWDAASVGISRLRYLNHDGGTEVIMTDVIRLQRCSTIPDSRYRSGLNVMLVYSDARLLDALPTRWYPDAEGRIEDASRGVLSPTFGFLTQFSITFVLLGDRSRHAWRIYSSFL